MESFCPDCGKPPPIAPELERINKWPETTTKDDLDNITEWLSSAPGPKVTSRNQLISKMLDAAIAILDENQILPNPSMLSDLEWETLTPEQRLIQWKKDLAKNVI